MTRTVGNAESNGIGEGVVMILDCVERESRKYGRVRVKRVRDFQGVFAIVTEWFDGGAWQGVSPSGEYGVTWCKSWKESIKGFMRTVSKYEKGV